MDIGIVTLWQSKDNYGQILQCYALQCYLKSKDTMLFLYVLTIIRTIALLRKN